MDVARLNFSHGTADDHARRFDWVREQSRLVGKPVAILQDLCGPKIRTGTVGPLEAKDGAHLDLIVGQLGTDECLAVDYEGLLEDVHPGDRVLLGDGNVELRVEGVSGQRLGCRVEHGGKLRARMGVNLPSRRVRLAALTEKDRADFRVGVKLGVDYAALSFVRSAADVEDLRALARTLGAPDMPILAKVETPSAVEQIDDVVRASDAVMVARGDLGVELPPEQVPVLQRQIMRSCRAHQRPVIVATEMLQSMVDTARPTRAEASDVASAVFQGADAVMLSAESATGKYPFDACGMMDRIIREAEASTFYEPAPSPVGSGTQDAIAAASCLVARDVGAAAIVALTQSGSTARLVSVNRPLTPIIAFSPEPRTLGRLALQWGIVSYPMAVATDINEAVHRIQAFLKENKLLQSGDRFVLAYGAPLGKSGSTNAIRVEQIP